MPDSYNKASGLLSLSQLARKIWEKKLEIHISPEDENYKLHGDIPVLFTPEKQDEYVFNVYFDLGKYRATLPAVTFAELEPPELENARVLLNGLSESRFGAAPLPNVTKELADINGIMESKVLQNKEYTIDSLTNEFKKHDYAIVHMATHGNFGGSPEKTYLTGDLLQFRSAGMQAG